MATFDQVNELGTGSADISSGQWAAVAAIIGSSSTRGLMWGNFADTTDIGCGSFCATDVNPNAYYYAYDLQNSWSYYNPGGPEGASDLGLWAFQTSSSVPEPATLLLLVTGCTGLLGYGWRKRGA